jgi:tetratricopeptide (TPR) repeat protein
MADGGELPDSARIELLCDGRTIRQVSTFSEGSFSFNLGNKHSGSVPDASVSSWDGELPRASRNSDGTAGFGALGLATSGLGRVDLNGCEVRLSPLAGYYAKPIPLKTRSIFDSPDIGKIVVLRLDGSQGTTVSLSTLSAPSRARKSFERARKEIRKKKPNQERAIQQLDKAVSQFPGFAEAWNLLGEIHLARRAEAAARDAFQNSIAADDRFIRPYLHLASLELQRRRWPEMAKLAGRLVELNPHVPMSHYFNGLATFHLGQLDVAEKSFLRLEQEEDFEFRPASFLLLGMIHSAQGLVPEAASEIQRYLELEDPSRVSPSLKRQLEEQLDQWKELGLLR